MSNSPSSTQNQFHVAGFHLETDPKFENEFNEKLSRMLVEAKDIFQNTDPDSNENYAILAEAVYNTLSAHEHGDESLRKEALRIMKDNIDAYSNNEVMHIANRMINRESDNRHKLAGVAGFNPNSAVA